MPRTDINEEEFLACARYGLMLAEENEDDAIRANLLKLVELGWRQRTSSKKQPARFELRYPPGHELLRHRVFRPGWPWPE